MAPVLVDPDKVMAFADQATFYDWLGAHHDSADEVRIQIFKRASCMPSITAVEAIEVVLCWDWINAIRKSWDAVLLVQRYCPRKARSTWSQINRDNIAKLIADGRMTEHGMVYGDKVRADGRWDAAYATTSRIAGGDRGQSDDPCNLSRADDAEPLRADIPGP